MKNVPEKFVKDCIALAHKRTSSGESLASVVSSLIYDVYAMGTTIGAAAEREACAKVCADIGKEYNNEINKKLGLGYELQEVAFDCEAAIRTRGQYD